VLIDTEGNMPFPSCERPLSVGVGLLSVPSGLPRRAFLLALLTSGKLSLFFLYDSPVSFAP